MNRIFGSNSGLGDEPSDSHLIHLAVALPFGTLAAFACYIDLDFALVGASNRTLGTRFSGSWELGDRARADYAGAFARQSEFGNNPAEFYLNYWNAEGGFARDGLALAAGIEVLEGDGARGFATPLGTLHAFQGFADLFLTTPARGIRDRKVKLSHSWTEVPHLGSVGIAGGFHSFHTYRSTYAGGTEAERDLGRELNLVLSSRPRPRVEFSVKLADHAGAGGVPDTRKLWVTAGLTLP